MPDNDVLYSPAHRLRGDAGRPAGVCHGVDRAFSAAHRGRQSRPGRLHHGDGGRGAGRGPGRRPAVGGGAAGYAIAGHSHIGEGPGGYQGRPLHHGVAGLPGHRSGRRLGGVGAGQGVGGRAAGQDQYAGIRPPGGDGEPAGGAVPQPLGPGADARRFQRGRGGGGGRRDVRHRHRHRRRRLHPQPQQLSAASMESSRPWAASPGPAGWDARRPTSPPSPAP